MLIISSLMATFTLQFRYLYFCNLWIFFGLYMQEIYIVGSQIVAHTLIETGNRPNKPNTINL